jgi:hypothetical protein
LTDIPARWVHKDAFTMPTIPEHLEIDPVFAALLHCSTFLEISGDKSVDPDWAVEALEHVAFYLQRLCPERIDDLREQLVRLLAFGVQNGWPQEFHNFVSNFFENTWIR